MGGETNRGRQIGADLKRCHARGQRRRRAAAGTAWRPRGVPRVVGATEDGISGLKVGEHHGDVRLADENASGGLKPGRHRAVLLGNVIRQGRESGGGAHPRGGMRVLEREGHTVQRSPDFSAGKRVIRLTRPFRCTLDIERDDGVERGVV